MKKIDIANKRDNWPKFEFSDLMYTKTVVDTNHDFIDKYDKYIDNMVVCKKCGLEGWYVGIEIKSYSPNRKCKNE